MSMSIPAPFLSSPFLWRAPSSQASGFLICLPKFVVDFGVGHDSITAGCEKQH
jgi:hypothetical protein